MSVSPFFRTDSYKDRWLSWVNDPLASSKGLIVDHTPSGPVYAPDGKVRICLYHIDFDERPTCYLDVNSAREAQFICDHFTECRGDWNVDYAVAWDDRAEEVAAYRIY